MMRVTFCQCSECKAIWDEPLAFWVEQANQSNLIGPDETQGGTTVGCSCPFDVIQPLTRAVGFKAKIAQSFVESSDHSVVLAFALERLLNEINLFASEEKGAE